MYADDSTLLSRNKEALSGMAEKLNKFKLLRSYITPEGDSKTEIKIKLLTARGTSTYLGILWKSKDLILNLKV